MGKQKRHSLIDKVYAMPNLLLAWEKVRANRGAGGIDGQTLKQFEAHLVDNLQELHRVLREGKYHPLPVRRVYIPKSDGSERPLGIPAVRDRVAQQAALQVLQPVFESLFEDCSYGFRPGRSAHQAIAKIGELRVQGYGHVVEVDLKSFFDTLDHELLVARVAEEIADGKVLSLIRGWLTAGVLEEGVVRTQIAGTPQGGVVSPLLANIYLHAFDREMVRRGYRVVRYADDLVVMCKSPKKARRALEVVQQLLTRDLKLTLHPEKTRLTSFREGFEFLGFHLYYRFKKPRAKAIAGFKDKVRHATRRQRPASLDTVIADLNPVIRGWGNYFRGANWKVSAEETDAWIRMRLRSFIRKHVTVRSKYNALYTVAFFQKKGLVTLTSRIAPAPC